MFQCKNCLLTVPAGTRANHVVRVQRAKNYPRRKDAHVVINPEKKEKRHKRKRKDDPGGSGVETVVELIVCAAYASALSRAD